MTYYRVIDVTDTTPQIIAGGHCRITAQDAAERVAESCAARHPDRTYCVESRAAGDYDGWTLESEWRDDAPTCAVGHFANPHNCLQYPAGCRACYEDGYQEGAN